MSGRDKSPPASCGKQQPKGAVALSEGSVNFGAAQSEESSGSEEDDESQQDLDFIHNKMKQLLQTESQTEDDWRSTVLEISEKQEGETFYPTQSLKKKDLFQNVPLLLLLQKSCPRNSENWVKEHWHQWVPGGTGFMIKTQDSFFQILGTRKKPQLVVLHGAAGIGKSMLARQVKRYWEEDQLYRNCFHHVFFFSCRELVQYKELSLGQLIAQGQAMPTATIRLVLSHPEKLLFILDGIDEPAWVLEEQDSKLCLHWNQPQPVHTLLGSLLRKSILPGASFLLTTRTTDLQKFIPSLRQSQLVEVLGFSESGWKNYFYQYFAEERDAITPFRLVESNPVLSTLCLVPWVCWLVCTCLSQEKKQKGDFSLISQTTTALCLKYLSQKISGQKLGTQLRALCSLAAEGICRRRTLFNEHDLMIQGLAKDDIVTFLKIGVLQKQPSSLSYSFAHLCLQEFFAAISYVLGNMEERHDYMENDRFMETLIEVYGKKDLFEAPIMHFLFGLLSVQGLKEMENIFACKLSWKPKLKLLSYFLEELLPHRLYSLGLFHCLFENQDEDLLTKVMHDFEKGKVDVVTDEENPAFQANVKYMVVKTDVELMVVAFCIKFCCCVKRLYLNMHEHRIQPLLDRSIVLHRWTPMTNVSWTILFSNLKLTRSLEELDLSGNLLSYSAVWSLRRTLMHPGCQLKSLWLVDCGLTSSHCTVLASVLSAPTSLTELDLQLNDLGDDGVKLLCEGLRSPACNLSILWLDKAPLSDEVIAELKALEEEKPQLCTFSTRTCICGVLSSIFSCNSKGQGHGNTGN